MQRGVAAGIVLLACLTFLAPPASGDPYHLQVSNDANGGGPESVDSGAWIAQSFRATSDFFVSRVALYVADTGTSGPLTVSIRPSSLNLPASTVLTQGMADGPSSAGWLDVNLNPYVPLSSTESYWIVARTAAPVANGYDWWTSGTDTAYLDGTGVRSPDGTVWSPRGRDYTFRVYGFVQPALSFSASLVNATVRVGDLVVAKVELSNAGPGTAQAIWVNVTLPPEISYVADDAPAAGGTLNGTYSYAFLSVGPGSRTFNVTLKAAPSVVNGTSVLVQVAIQPTDHNGEALAPFIRNLEIRIVGGPNAPIPLADDVWWWPFPILAALGAATVLLLWRNNSRKVVVDEVFVGDRHGILLAHRSSSPVQYQDEDILVGMFKAVQDFVKDAFSRGVEEEFHALEFGERRIMIEQGRAHFIAVVYRGENKVALKGRVQKVSRAIDEGFGDKLESWNGDVDAVKGIALLLPKVWSPRARSETGVSNA